MSYAIHREPIGRKIMRIDYVNWENDMSEMALGSFKRMRPNLKLIVMDFTNRRDYEMLEYEKELYKTAEYQVIKALDEGVTVEVNFDFGDGKVLEA